MPPFVIVGASFSLESVIQLSLATIRVTFTNDPKAINPTAADDGLNPANYTLVGSLPLTVTVAATVPGLPQCIDLTVSAPFTIGSWTLTCSSALKMLSGTAITAPLASSFTTVYVADLATVANGAHSDTAATIIRKHLNPYLKGRVWNALIAALAVGDNLNWANARLIFDQLFTSSASGVYLDRRAADNGITRPANIGMPDDLFRQYSINTTTSKLVKESLLEILEVFYGSDCVRAYADAALNGPYVLHDQDNLEVLLDGRDLVNIVFTSADFAQIGQASSLEVAAAITRACERQGVKAYAVSVLDPATGLSTVRIYSASLGLGSSVQATSGLAQAFLEFPLALDVATAAITGADAYSWVCTMDPAGDSTTFSLTTAAPVKMDISLVQTGDWVIVDAATSGQVGGIYEILDAAYWYAGPNLVQTFTVAGNVFIGQLITTQTGLQLSENAYRFFRPERQTIQRGNGRTIVVSQTTPNQLELSLPATSQAVGRASYTGAYAQVNSPLTVTGLTRIGTTVNVIAANTLTVGDQIYVDEAYGTRVGPTINAAVAPTTRNSVASLWSPVAAVGAQNANLHHTITALDNGNVLRVGGLDVLGMGLDTADVCAFTALPDGVNGEKKWDAVWAAVGNLTEGRCHHAAITLRDPAHYGHVAVFGGWFAPGFYRDSIEVYNPAVGWSVMPVWMPDLIALTEVCRLPDNRIVIVGGMSGMDETIDYVNVWDPATGVMTAPIHMASTRAVHSIAVLPNGKVLITGGRLVVIADGLNADSATYLTADGFITADCEIFDPATGTCTKTGAMAYTRMGHELVNLPDGRILCIGGYGTRITRPYGVRSVISDMEVYDPATGRWSPAGRLQTGRAYPAVGLLPGCNKIVVASGQDTSGNRIGLEKSEYVDAVTMKRDTIPNSFLPQPSGSLVGNTKNSACVMSGDRLFFSNGYDVGLGIPEAALFVRGDDRIGNGGLNGIHRVTTANGAGFTYETPDYPGYTVGPTTTKIVPVQAPNSAIPGPYVFGPDTAPGITAVSSVTTQALDKGHSYQNLEVADATLFPDEPGWLCVSFGTSEQDAPIQYLGRYSATALMLDYTYKFPFTVAAGASVVLLVQKGSWTPETVQAGLYITASPAGRVAAQAALEEAVAAGVGVNTTIVYPGDNGLGGAGLPTTGKKISDVVGVFGGDDLDTELAEARNV